MFKPISKFCSGLLLASTLTLTASVFTLFFTTTVHAQSSTPAANLILRIDDVGMNYAKNEAAEKLLQTGIPFSVSVMPATPWFQGAADLLRDQPQASVGIHLTLTSEWKHYKWGPILGRESVPSLVDFTGYFWASTQEFLDHDPDLDEVERELRAQIQRALDHGLKIDYLDHHMGTAVSTPELREIVEKLAEEFEVGISGYFGEHIESLWSDPITEKADVFLDILDNMEPNQTTVAVLHLTTPTQEMQQLVDLNAEIMNTSVGDPLTWKHRKAELDMILNPKIAERMAKPGINVITYNELISILGLDSMQRPD